MSAARHMQLRRRVPVYVMSGTRNQNTEVARGQAVVSSGLQRLYQPDNESIFPPRGAKGHLAVIEIAFSFVVIFFVKN